MGVKTCILIVTIHVLYLVSAQEMIKRVPQGFLGMRGKKFASESTEQFEKRKPQFFVGVKGKRQFLDEIDDINYKRAPMGFVGMRGKKESYLPDVYYTDGFEYAPKRDGSLIGQIDYSSNDNTKMNDLEFPFLNNILTEYLKLRPSIDTAIDTNEDLSNERITNEVDKRAANMHQFYGVRGKKAVQNKRPYDLSFRGKFIGVRGKKDLKNSDAQEIRFLLGQNGPWPKRKAQMGGFFGMRGKKWTDESSPEIESSN